MIVLVGNRVHTLKTKSSLFTAVKMRDDSAIQSYLVTLQLNDPEAGHCIGNGKYQKGSSANIEAIPNLGYIFKRWSDGSTEPTRTLVVEEDITLTAIFERDSSIGILTYIPNKEYLNPSPNGKVFIYNSLYESL